MFSLLYRAWLVLTLNQASLWSLLNKQQEIKIGRPPWHPAPPPREHSVQSGFQETNHIRRLVCDTQNLKPVLGWGAVCPKLPPMDLKRHKESVFWRAINKISRQMVSRSLSFQVTRWSREVQVGANGAETMARGKVKVWTGEQAMGSLEMVSWSASGPSSEILGPKKPVRMSARPGPRSPGKQLLSQLKMPGCPVSSLKNCEVIHFNKFNYSDSFFLIWNKLNSRGFSYYFIHIFIIVSAWISI